MCYRTTCLYSLCGHTSISQRPIRNLPPCPHQSAAIAIAIATTELDPKAPQTHTIATESDNLPLVLSFPSPQEYELARELHHSVPASPVSPVFSRSNRASKSSRKSFASQKGDDQEQFDILSGYYESPSSPSQSEDQIQIQSPAIPHCPSSQTHPIHTFIVPTFCDQCHVLRASNLARFEARAIRNSVEREGRGAWNRRSQGQMGNGRKRIWGVKGGIGEVRMIPLICVEEGRLKGEAGEGKEKENEGLKWALGESMAGVEREMNPDMDADGSDLGTEGLENVKPADVCSTEEYSSTGTTTLAGLLSPLPTPGLPLITTPPPNPQPPQLQQQQKSMWFRWISRSLSPSPSSRTGPRFTSVTNPDPPVSDKEGNSTAGGLASPGLMPRKLSTGVEDMERWDGGAGDVDRDAAGWNAKGMQRISRWDRGEVGRGGV